MSQTAVPPRVAARFWEQGEWDSVHCRLCPHQCSIAPSRSGTCGVRTNRNGTLYLDTWGRIALRRAAQAPELPLYHFKPASTWLLLGLKGCNMRCTFCNTWQFSQTGGVRSEPMAPDAIVAAARAAGACGVSFGVSEPAIAHEFVSDVFKAAREAGLLTHIATSGEWSNEPFSEMLPLTDAVTFGAKGWNERFVAAECGGHMDLLKLNIETAIARRIHVEIAWLAVEETASLGEDASTFAAWVAERRPRTPVIVQALRKEYSWRGGTTSPEVARAVFERMRQHLANVYIADGVEDAANTHCPNCGKTLVWRGPSGTSLVPLNNGACPGCGAQAPMVP